MDNDAQQSRLMISNGTVQRTFFEVTLYFDGSAQPNPGAGGCGVYLLDDCDNVLYEGGAAVEPESGDHNVTSNQAEYAGLVMGLHKALRVRGDSELVIQQMKGQYACTSKRLVQWHATAERWEERFQVVEYEHISRGGNTVADGLAKAHCDWC